MKTQNEQIKKIIEDLENRNKELIDNKRWALEMKKIPVKRVI